MSHRLQAARGYLEKPGILLALSAWLFFLAFFVTAFRISAAPDLFTDEILYSRIGVRIAGEGAMVWDSGEPFVVHPPLYFALEGIFFKLTGGAPAPALSAGNIFETVIHARYMNVLIAGLTAVILFWIGKRINSVWLGLLLAVLFIADPFGVRINRRAMLETLTGFLVLCGMALLLANTTRSRPSLRFTVWGAVFLGLAVLSKELALINLFAIILYGLWEIWLLRGKPFFKKNSTAFHAMVAALIASATYLLYPLWILTTGYWDKFISEKSLGVLRVFGIVQLTGWNRPGVSLMDFLVRRLVDYGSSYMLLALGGLAVGWIFLFGRSTRTGRLLAAWGAVLYPFYAFTALIGSGNDQFFYLLLVPAIVLVGYALTLPVTGIRWVNRNTQPYQAALAGLMLVVMLTFNVIRWMSVFGIGIDNGYAQLTQFVTENIPLNEPINASGDPIKFHYFFPNRPVTDAATSSEAMESGVHYYVLVPKDVKEKYGDITSDLADWIEANGTPIFQTSGSSYGDILLYKVDFEGGSQPAPEELLGDGRHWRSFKPAVTGKIWPFYLMVGAWILTASAVTFAPGRPRIEKILRGGKARVTASDLKVERSDRRGSA